ncbi:low temperature requirement protein A [Nonomuraea sp. NPDC050310]|uniref:low temperature requirement protein A n=1 Tax=Nonomuraea sp. NPDC050310 TaxID=3154935 RepID=UPI0033D257CE
MTASGERHASWLELFFDLVVVAAVVQLAHRLHDPSWAGATVTLTLFYAIWSVWISYTLYANVAATRTRTRSILIGMFGIAVMAAAVPGVGNRLPEVQDTRDFAFAVAYVICRFTAAGTFRKAGTVMTSWPTAQLSRGLALGPWILSIWFDAPVTYQLWFVGIVLDILVSVRRSRDPERIMARVRKKQARHKGRDPLATRGVLDPEHLGERLGLFTIIVLGEAVMQVVIGAAKVAWDLELGLVAVAGFALVVSLWWLTFQYGVSAAPQRLGGAALRPSVALTAHFFMTAGIVALAAGLGVTAENPDTALPPAVAWLMCAGLSLNLAASAALGTANGAGRRWTWGYAVPTALLPLAVGLFGLDLDGWLVVTLLVLAPLWRIRYRPSGDQTGARSSAGPDAGPPLPAT